MLPGNRAPDTRRKDPSPVNSHQTSYELTLMVQSYLDQLKRAPPGKQMALGGAAGFALGYLSGKIGRSVFKSIGLTLLLVHLCERQGYILIDWEKINEEADSSAKSCISSVKRIFHEQFVTASSFLAGALLGLGI